MSNNIKNTGSLIVAAIFGSIVTFVSFSLFSDNPSTVQDIESSEKTPLYWVAPMDANYKRDKPGKSPMGMDLVPVYEDGGSESGSGPGTIKISPEVINNLGVRTVTAKYQPLHSQISTVGYIKYDEDQLVHIHPRVDGWIEKLHVKASGDRVKKDQALYEIYSPALVNAQEELLLALDRKNQRLIRAAEDRLKALQLPEHAIKKLKQSKKVKQLITFYAPQTGVVDNLNIREGFYVKPGTTLMSIGTLAQVWVEAEVFERQASDVTVGLPVTMSLAYLPGTKWEGKVNYIYPTLNAKTRTLKVRLRFDNKNETLKPNMFAQVNIHTQSEENSLLIPKEAVIRSGTKERVVLALGDGRFKSINVNVGRYDGEFAEILSGLNEGEKVVSSAQFLLDSESSKSSDFKRMNFETEGSSEPSAIPQEMLIANVWVEATINSVMAGHRMLNVTHQAIAEWKWPEMTMDFMVAKTVDMTLLKDGMTLHIEVQNDGNGQYEVINVHIPDSEMNMEKK
ncbi:MAG: efflux RND transporter periplasmic adaptor subunit [Maribacter sp.]|nr:efflux RND transporter periplasmic adaptor subunit [Maribacter sp.]